MLSKFNLKTNLRELIASNPRENIRKTKVSWHFHEDKSELFHLNLFKVHRKFRCDFYLKDKQINKNY